MNDLTVIVFGEAGLEAVHLSARDDRFALHISVALYAVHWNQKKKKKCQLPFPGMKHSKNHTFKIYPLGGRMNGFQSVWIPSIGCSIFQGAILQNLLCHNTTTMKSWFTIWGSKISFQLQICTCIKMKRSCSRCFKTFFGGSPDFPKIKKLNEVCSNVWTCIKM